MSRSGYVEDGEQWELICWRGAVKSAIRGKRGQAFLKEMLAALDAMPEKRLITGDLEQDDGSVCAIGAVGKARGIAMTEIDPEDHRSIAAAFNIANALAREIMFENDEIAGGNDPRLRWRLMRNWIVTSLIEEGTQ